MAIRLLVARFSVAWYDDDAVGSGGKTTTRVLLALRFSRTTATLKIHIVVNHKS